MALRIYVAFSDSKLDAKFPHAHRSLSHSNPCRLRSGVYRLTRCHQSLDGNPDPHVQMHLAPPKFLVLLLRRSAVSLHQTTTLRTIDFLRSQSSSCPLRYCFNASLKISVSDFSWSVARCFTFLRRLLGSLKVVFVHSSCWLMRNMNLQRPLSNLCKVVRLVLLRRT